MPAQLVGDLAVDVADRLRHALAAVALAAVAQLDRLVLAGRRPARHGGPARAPRWPARPRPRRSGCPASRGSRGPATCTISLIGSDHRSAPAGVPAWADGSPAHRQAGDRDRRQPGHRQGGRPGAGRRGLRRRRSPPAAAAALEATAAELARRDRPARSSPIVVDTGDDESVRAMVAARRRRASAASTSSSTAPPSRSARRRRRSWPTSPASCSGTT